MSSGQGRDFEAKLAAKAVMFGSARIPPAAIAAAKTNIMDWLGCALAGSDSEPARILAEIHAHEFTADDKDDMERSRPAGATCFTGGKLAHPRLSALVNGVASHVLELDDIYSPALYHPGVCVIPAALAASQKSGASGDGFLRSVIAGYELSNRIGAAINPSHYEFWHTTGTVGTLGAAIAASVALKLDERQSGWAIGHAASMAAGLQQAFRSDGMTKPLHAGRAAEGGVLAALLAERNFVSPQAMISGDVGFAAAMSGETGLSECLDDLFEIYTVERSTHKRFSACGHTFAPVDATLELMQAHVVDVEHIEAIGIETYQKAVDIAGIQHPQSAFEAKFSIPFCVAASLLGHDLSDVNIFDRHCRDKDIHDLIGRVSTVAAESISRKFPQMRGATVTLRQKGETLTQMVPTRKGEPANPLPQDALRGKFRGLVSASSYRGSEDLWLNWVDQLDRLGTVRHYSLPVATQTQLSDVAP